MKKRGIPAVLLAAAACCASARAADTPEPGMYEIVTRSAAGKPESTKQCLTSADIARGFQTSDMGKDCKTTRSVVAGGKFEFVQSCPDMTMTASGTYTPTSYVVDGRLSIKSDGEAISIETHGSGRKIGPCRP